MQLRKGEKMVQTYEINDESRNENKLTIKYDKMERKKIDQMSEKIGGEEMFT